VDSLSEHLRETDAERARAWLRTLRGRDLRPSLPRYLAWKYGADRLLARAGRNYPVVCRRARSNDVESVLGTLDLAPAAPTDGVVSRLAQLADPRLTNGHVYVMRHASFDTQPIFDCGLGRYFGMLDTCSAIEVELRAAVRDGECEPQELDDKLARRNAAHTVAGGDPISCGVGRDAALGVSMLVACRTRDVYQMRLARRGEGGLGIAAGLLHVVPSGMFDFTDARAHYNVTAKLREEYAEELFRNASGTLEYLDLLTDRGEARLLLTGVAMDLLNLRPEICSMLVIDQPEWFERARGVQLNDEFAAEEAADGWVRLASDEDMIAQSGLLPEAMVPPGAAAFWMGVDVLREVVR